MNLILFEKDEIGRPLGLTDARARHIREILHRAIREPFDCGVVDGPRGKAWITAEDRNGLHLEYAWDVAPPALDPVWLLVGLPRPQTARKILREASALGVSGLVFFSTERGETSYALSTLWTSDETRRLLLEGVAQAFCTRLPACTRAESLTGALAVVAPMATRLALDNYEAATSLNKTPVEGAPAVLALGSERGWSPRERDELRAHGFSLAHLGPRVLRVETACVAGLTLLKARLGLLP